jgi:lysophospholipase L1-like esterase
MTKKLISNAATLFAAGAVLARPGHATAQTTPYYLHDGDQVVTYGDSITDQRLYTVDIEAFTQTRYPDLTINWVNSGWGGDTVKGGAGGDIETRINRDIIPYHPTVMTVMLGMNDGGYAKFDKTKFDTYADGYRHILQEVSEKVPGVRYTLLTPSPWDDVNYPLGYLFFAGAPGYNVTLTAYSDEVRRIGAEFKAQVVDFNSTMNTLLSKAKEIDSTNAKDIIPGRVHPSPGGHVFMAAEMAKGWGMGSMVSMVGLDAAAGAVTTTTNAQAHIQSTQGGLTWTTTEGALPLPIDFQDKITRLVIQASDIVDTLDQEILQIASLPAASYQLKIDDKDIAAFTREQLAAGVNLATLDTPMLEQAMKVLQYAHQHTDIHWEVWRNVRLNLTHYDSPAVNDAVNKAIEHMEAANQEAVAMERKTAHPLPHTFALVPKT